MADTADLAAVNTSANDPVLALIATSNRHFQAGVKELTQDHVEAAKLEFNRAVDVLLASPYGVHSEPRIRDHFDQLVDRIGTYQRGGAQAEGVTETTHELANQSVVAPSAPPPPVVPEPKGAAQPTEAEHDIAIPLNRRVLNYIDLFQGRLHDFIEEGMKRGSKYLPMIQNVLRAEGLPLDLAYVPLVESAFKPEALSRAKAKGVWQFMSGTALENGLRRDWYIDERSDPEKATVAAAHYLGTLGKLFDGDWHLALASYNGGPGRLQRAIRRAGLDDFWELAAKPKLLPRETREYVPMILAAIVIARNPAQYGFEFVPEQAPAFEKVTLPGPVDLRRVAEWTDTTIGEIQALNPELRRWTTPVRDTRYELRVPKGTADFVQARLAEASGPDLSSLKWYIVKQGDTLPAVARKLGVNKIDLAEANYLSVRARLTNGQKLLVPHQAAVLLAGRTERTPPAAEVRAIEADRLTRPVNSNRVKIMYRVKRGDTLASIARAFRTNVAALKSWNKLAGNRVSAGTHLTIYRRNEV
jgi:membrane-bound lytic murein transglycosylase D